MGALFYDLPANIVGSAVMGLLTPTDTLAKIHGAPLVPGIALAFLPPQSRLQTNTALHIGLRTGYCGSLTTFSSWQLQMVKMICGSGQQTWLAAVVGYYLGTTVSLSSLVLGQHLAMWAHRQITKPSKSLPQNQQQMSTRSPSRATPPQPPPATPPSPGQPAAAFQLEDAPQDGTPPPTPPSPPTRTFRFRFTAADVTSLAVLAALTSVCVYIVSEYSQAPQHATLFQDYLAVLLGPVGCLLRWQLGRLNFKLPGSWAWLPLGTFLANMLACTLSFSLAAALVTKSAALSTTSTAVMNAAMLGISGALSTVSTWVAEIQQMLAKFPHEVHAYTYIAMSLVGSLVLGVAVFGTSTWVA